MSSGPVELRGAQRPRTLWVPPYVSSAGEEAAELAVIAGLHLDPWECFVLTESLGERRDGKWAALEIALEVSRQNGKGAILEARQLAGLFILGEEVQVHSAHRFSTAKEAFRRLLRRIEETPDLSRELKKRTFAHGEEGIELHGNRRINFRTRANAGGRGLTGDTLYLDEAMEIKESTHGDLFPILSARPNPQIWYTGSAVNQEVHDHGVVFARIRERGLRGDDPRLAWFGWGEPSEILPEEAGVMLDDPEAWARANPALGIRISSEFIEVERLSLSPRNFAVERLGIGDWPSTKPAENADQLLPSDAWAKRLDPASRIAEHLALALDVSPNRSTSSICAGGVRGDGRKHVELVEKSAGTRWVVGRLVELVRDHACKKLVIDGRGPAKSLLEEIEEALQSYDVEIKVLTTEEYVQACGRFFDDVVEGGLHHLGQPALDIAVEGAVPRPLGDAFAYSRRKSAVDITPVVGCTLAHFGASEGEEESVYNDRDLLVLD